MSKNVAYRQCKLNKGNTYQVAWIPEIFSVLGKALKIKTEKGWDDGWVVESVSHARREDAIDIHKAIRGHRKNTGDSLPKSE